MPIKYVDWITRELVRANPDCSYVFGDNRLRQGMGGQAGAMRGEPNAIGVATKRRPSMHTEDFFSDNYWPDRMVITSDLFIVDQALQFQKTVYVPRDGLGTGLSQLPTRAPRLYKMLWDFFNEREGEGCPWPQPEEEAK